MSWWHFILSLENGSRQLGGWRSRLPQLHPASPGAPTKSLGHFRAAWILYVVWSRGFFAHQFAARNESKKIQKDFCSHHASLSRGQCDNACSDCLMPPYIFLSTGDEAMSWTALKAPCCPVHLACLPSIPDGWNRKTTLLAVFIVQGAILKAGPNDFHWHFCWINWAFTVIVESASYSQEWRTSHHDKEYFQ